MRPWHLMSVALNMRERDREVFGTVYPEKDPEKWACRRSLAVGLHFAVLDNDGRPQACFGFTEDPGMEGVALAWVVSCPGAERYAKSMRRAFDKVVEQNIFRVIRAECTERRHAGLCDYFKWLGFALVGTIPGYCVNGETLELYQLRRQA